MDKIILENKARTWWALDEVIGKDTKYEGSTSFESLQQIIGLINKYTTIDRFNYINNVISESLIIFNRTLTDLKSKYSKIYTNLPDSSIPIKLYCSGWEGHAISLFIKYNSEDNYNVGIINCGLGAEIHGFQDNYTFGIIVFENITRVQIKSVELYLQRCHLENTPYQIIYLMIFKFLGEYYQDYQDDENDEMEHRDNNYNILQQIPEENHDLVYNRLQELTRLYLRNKKKYTIKNFTNIIKYKTYSQIIGSCTFTNIINFIYYYYCINNESENHLDDYLAWYDYLKIQFKTEILNEILDFSKSQTITLDLYNIYNYIKISIESEANEIQNIVFKDDYDKYMIQLDKDTKIEPYIDESMKNFKDYFDSIFSSNLKENIYITSDEFYECVSNNNHSYILKNS
jgi:hypothetical protein